MTRMAWRVALAALGGFATGCDGTKPRKPVQMAPIGAVPIATRTTAERAGGTTTTPNSGTPSPMREAACAGDDFEVLDDALKPCDTKMPRATGGGRVDVTVTFKNKAARRHRDVTLRDHARSMSVLETAESRFGEIGNPS